MPLQRMLPLATALAAVLAVLVAAPAGAAVVADTGAPDGLGAPLVLDGANSYAGRIHLGARQDIRGIEAYLDGGSAGETFTLAVYDDSAGQLPGNLLYSATASYAAAGWNGLTGLAGWTVTDHSDVWVAI